jgi:hypothetical protein
MYSDTRDTPDKKKSKESTVTKTHLLGTQSKLRLIAPTKSRAVPVKSMALYETKKLRPTGLKNK